MSGGLSFYLRRVSGSNSTTLHSRGATVSYTHLARIGEERYARTWNLLQGYAGYRQERDAFLQLSPSADTYIEQMYLSLIHIS